MFVTHPIPMLLELLANAGNRSGGRRGVRRGGTLSVSGGLQSICEVREGPRRSVVSSCLPDGARRRLGRMHLRITWDDRSHASVDAPLDLLFGAGTLHNPDGREWLVKALPVAIRFAAGRVVLSASSRCRSSARRRSNSNVRADRADRRRQVGGERRAVRRGVEHVGYSTRRIETTATAVRRGPGVSRYA